MGCKLLGRLCLSFVGDSNNMKILLNIGLRFHNMGICLDLVLNTLLQKDKEGDHVILTRLYLSWTWSWL